MQLQIHLPNAWPCKQQLETCNAHAITMLYMLMTYLERTAQSAVAARVGNKCFAMQATADVHACVMNVTTAIMPARAKCV